MRYNNYHSHKIYSNLKSLDVITKPRQYMERMKELGHNIYFTTEHGYQGNVFEAHMLCKEYGFKLVVGAELYYVNNRYEKDKSNYHIVIVCLNTDGYKQLNKIISESNISGMYYKPRIDEELLLSLNPDNVIVTTACSGGRLRNEEGLDEWLIKMKNHFGNNFYLEVQAHVHESQIKHNKIVLDKSNKFNIDIIHANDSHYIYPSEAKYRDLFLKAKGIVYEEEEGFILDYPDTEIILDRYSKQGVLSKEQVFKAINNTLIFDRCEELDINFDIKIPRISDNPNKELKSIINKAWLEERKHIPASRHREYLDAIKYEMDIIEKTGMEEYFVINHKMVNRAVEKYGGVITRTGRGSAPSFIINKLLGLTDIDRLDCPVTLYPTRFMSAERILTSKSLPDIDMNTANPNPFIKASKDLLGEDGCQWMIAYKPLQDSSAFRLYCKAIGMKLEEYNDIAKNLNNYLEDEYWKPIIEESKHFRGVVESVAPSPCSTLLLDKPISEEVGLIRVGDMICCNLDGFYCDKYKYLKNDILTVSVWSIIKETCELIGIDIPTIRELKNLLNSKAYDMYKYGLTTTLNQADSDFATPLFQKYSPRNIAEVSQMVCMIRPGAASMLEDFLDRKPYTTGVKELDELLSDSAGRMCYQESVMSFLIWLGVKESVSYDILKKIAKKSFKENELNELREELIEGWTNRVGTIDGFEKMWTIVEQNAKYSFNSSHSVSVGLDSLYGAYLKANYPLEYYAVVFNHYEGDIERTAKLTKELDFFGIELKNPKFRYSKGEYFIDKETNAIFKGVESIKYLNKEVGEYLYSLRNKQYNSFIELLDDIKGVVNSRQLNILIELDYFSEFGKSKKLKDIVEIYNTIYNKKQFKKDNLPCDIEVIRKFAKTETEKIFKDIDQISLCKYIESSIENIDIPIQERIRSWIENTGNCNLIDSSQPKNKAIVIDINTKYKTPKIKLYNLYSGKTAEVKIGARLWREYKLELFDMITIVRTNSKFKKKKFDNKWIETDEKEYWLEDYIICKIINKIFVKLLTYYKN